MARVVCPTPEQWAVLRELALLLDGAAVIISPEVQAELRAEGVDPEELDAEDYDFGGDADFWIDVVHNRDDYFLSKALPKSDEDDDDGDR